MKKYDELKELYNHYTRIKDNKNCEKICSELFLIERKYIKDIVDIFQRRNENELKQLKNGTHPIFKLLRQSSSKKKSY